MTKMIRFLALLSLFPSLAAAQGVLVQPRNPIEIFDRNMRGNVRLDTLVRWENVSATLPIAYDAAVRVVKHHVKLPVEQVDTVAKVVYNKRLIVSSRLAGQPMSRWLRCGTGLKGDHADTWRITLAYAVFVDSAAADASRIGVALFATARNTEGVSTSAVACASTGALEREIVGKVREVVQSL